MMKCHKCEGSYVEVHECLTVHDSQVGLISLPRVKYLKCNRCSDALFPAETSRLLDIIKKEILSIFIANYPIKGFMSSSETAQYLGITKQALHKNKRIRRGFIYHLTLDGMIYYINESVVLYKIKGDGRFPINLSPVDSTSSLLAHSQSTFQSFGSYAELHSGSSDSSVNPPSIPKYGKTIDIGVQ